MDEDFERQTSALVDKIRSHSSYYIVKKILRDTALRLLEGARFPKLSDEELICRSIVYHYLLDIHIHGAAELFQASCHEIGNDRTTSQAGYFQRMLSKTQLRAFVEGYKEQSLRDFLLSFRKKLGISIPRLTTDEETALDADSAAELKASIPRSLELVEDISYKSKPEKEESEHSDEEFTGTVDEEVEEEEEQELAIDEPRSIDAKWIDPKVHRNQSLINSIQRLQQTLPAPAEPSLPAMHQKEGMIDQQAVPSTSSSSTSSESEDVVPSSWSKSPWSSASLQTDSLITASPMKPRGEFTRSSTLPPLIAPKRPDITSITSLDFDSHVNRLSSTSSSEGDVNVLEDLEDNTDSTQKSTAFVTSQKKLSANVPDDGDAKQKGDEVQDSKTLIDNHNLHPTTSAIPQTNQKSNSVLNTLAQRDRQELLGKEDISSPTSNARKEEGDMARNSQEVAIGSEVQSRNLPSHISRGTVESAQTIPGTPIPHRVSSLPPLGPLPAAPTFNSLSEAMKVISGSSSESETDVLSSENESPNSKRERKKPEKSVSFALDEEDNDIASSSSRSESEIVTSKHSTTQAAPRSVNEPDSSEHRHPTGKVSSWLTETAAPSSSDSHTAANVLDDLEDVESLNSDRSTDNGAVKQQTEDRSRVPVQENAVDDTAIDEDFGDISVDDILRSDSGSSISF